MQPISIRLGGRFLLGIGALQPYEFEGNPLTYYDLTLHQQLTIESISAYVGVPPGQRPSLVLEIWNHQNPTPYTYAIPLQFQATYNPTPDRADLPDSDVLRDWYSMNHALRIYVPGDNRIQLVGWRSQADDGSGVVQVTLTGYLETIPQIKLPWTNFHTI